MVEVRLEQAAPRFLAELARLDCGGTGIVHRDSVDVAGRWRYPIGTGPFRWGEWRHKQFIDLPRFDGYRSLPGAPNGIRSEEHTSELQSLMRISYAVFCLKKKKKHKQLKQQRREQDQRNS